MKTNDEVLIVGAGPTGLTLACLLRQYGLSCRVIDKREKRQFFSKAFALHARTIELLNLLNVDEEIKRRAFHVKHMDIYAQKKLILNFDFSLLNSGSLNAVFSIPQFELEQILESRLRELGGQVEYGTALVDLEQNTDGVTTVINNDEGQQRVTYPFVVGCDGVYSQVRALANIDIHDISYDNSFIVADGTLLPCEDTRKLDLDKGHTFLSLTGYTMIFPLPDNQYRIVIDVPKEAITREAVTEEYFYGQLANRGFPHLRFSHIVWLSKADLSAKLADRYYNNRIILAGDACHIHSPIGGQGINLGVQDSINLGWKLVNILQGRESQDILQSYEAERRVVAKRVIMQIDKLHRLFTTEKLLTRFIRDRLLAKIASFKVVGTRFVENVAGFSINYGKASNKTKFRGMRIGSRCPNQILLQDSHPHHLYQLLNKVEPLWLVYTNDKALLSQAVMMPQTQIIYITSSANMAAQSSVIYQDKHYGNHEKGWMMSVRPDGYIQYLEGLNNVKQLSQLSANASLTN